MIMQMWSKGIQRIQTSALLGICLLTGTLRATVAITPAFVDVDLSQGRPSGVFYISNLGEKEERFRVTATPWNYTEEGMLTQSPTERYSLASSIRFNPRELTIAPGTQRVVRFAIAPKEKLAEGEWWAAMELESLDVAKMVRQDEKGGHTLQISAISKIVAPVFGTVGKPSYQGQIKDVQVQTANGEVFLRALVAANGTGRLGIQGDSRYEIVNAGGEVVDSGPFAAGYVFRGAQRWFIRKIEATIPKGEYTVKLSLAAAHLEQPLTKESRVSWPEVAPKAQDVAQPSAPPAADQIQGQPKSPTDGDKQPEVQGRAGNK
jgi:hypothetical protein